MTEAKQCETCAHLRRGRHVKRCARPGGPVVLAEMAMRVGAKCGPARKGYEAAGAPASPASLGGYTWTAAPLQPMSTDPALLDLQRLREEMRRVIEARNERIRRFFTLGETPPDDGADSGFFGTVEGNLRLPLFYVDLDPSQ